MKKGKPPPIELGTEVNLTEGEEEEAKEKTVSEILNTPEKIPGLGELLKRLSELTPEEAAKLVAQTTSSLEQGQELSKEIKKKFHKDYNIPEDSIVITDLEENEKGVNKFHKVVTFTKNEIDRKLHVKTAATSSNLSGSRLNEIFIYKVLENLGYGPKSDVMLVGSDALLTISEDIISSKDAKHHKGDKNRSFSTVRQDLSKMGRGQSLDIHKDSSDPKSFFHFIALDIIKNAMQLTDVAYNYGNLGIRKTETNPSQAATTKEDLATNKQRVMIIDSNLRADITRDLAQNPSDVIEAMFEGKRKNLFATKDGHQIGYTITDKDDELVSKALEKLESGKNLKEEKTKLSFIKAADEALEFVKEFKKRIPEIERIDSYDIEPVEEYCELIKKRFAEFSRGIKEKLQSRKNPSNSPSSASAQMTSQERENSRQ